MKANQISILTIAVALALSSCSTQSRPPPQSSATPPAIQSDGLDLVAVSVTYEPNPPHVGDKMVFHQVVHNDGTATAKGRTYDVDFYIDGEAVCFDHGTSDLPPGRSVSYKRIDWVPTKARRYHYRLVVDERGTVRESNKKNNVLEGEIDVLP